MNPQTWNRAIYPSLKIKLLCVLACLWTANLRAGPQPEQLERLQADLTPVGALRAGNTDGRIPAWAGGINQLPDGYQPGTTHLDPYAGETPLLRINASNLEEHTLVRPVRHGGRVPGVPAVLEEVLLFDDL